MLVGLYGDALAQAQSLTRPIDVSTSCAFLGLATRISMQQWLP